MRSTRPLAARAPRRAPSVPRSAPLRLALAGVAAGFFNGCSSSEDGDAAEAPFVLRATPHAVAGSTPLLGDGNHLAYLASESTTGPGGTDMNGDGDVLDSIAVRLLATDGSVRSLDVAARAIHFLNGTLLVEVDEASDGRDWNSDTDTADRVLLYHRLGDLAPTFYAELSATVATAALVAGDTLFLVGPTAPTMELETDVAIARVVTAGEAPGAPMPLVSTIDDPFDDGVSLAIVAAAGDVVAFAIDETVDGILNGDGDATDTTILALADGRELAPTVLGTGLPLSSATAFAARAAGTERLVAFLVSEAAHGVNLNAAALFSGAWQPANCSGREDVDQLDHVLHWCLMSDLAATGTVVNTGLVGPMAGPVLVHPESFVAVVSSEASEGNNGCDLNGDGDFIDPIFRWVAAVDPTAPVLPVVDSTRLLAVQTALPGGSGGMLAVGSVFAISVDEALDGRDHDGDPGVDRVLVAAHSPSLTGQAWNFEHGSGTPQPVGVSYFAADERDAQRFAAAITEEARGTDLNGDGDELDSIPTFPGVLSANRLGFPGVGSAVPPSNAGICTAGGYAFYRVSEAADGANDRNGDGDATDLVLQRVRLDGGSSPFYMGSTNTLLGPVLGAGLDGVEFGAFLYQESMFGPMGNDLNGDGDANDLVVRWFRLP